MRDDDIQHIDHRVKWGLLIVSVLTLLALARSALLETRFADWRELRSRYAKILDQRASDDHEKALADAFRVEIVQNVVPALHRTDRCITCHAGLDDPRMRDLEQPFRTHPGKYLEVHDPNKFGCTVCHDGQGLALETPDAHGHSKHWERPMLAREHNRTACSRCHDPAETLDLAFLTRLDDAAPSGSGAQLMLHGRRLVERSGCLGCHMLDGKGGNLGPELTTVGDKTRHNFDFSHADRSLGHESADWLRAHFLDPRSLAPTSVMPAVGSPEEADALTAYMLSLHAKEPMVHPAAEPATPLDGGRLFGLYCSACHGPDGTGSPILEIPTPTLNNPDALSVCSDDFFRSIIENGRSSTEMPAWKRGAGNLDEDEVDRIVARIRGWDVPNAAVADASSRVGDVRSGRAYYLGRCANCHGREGEGGVGNSLNSPTFLAVASDDFLAETIVNGRLGTAMPSTRELDAQAISDLLAYLRSWQAKAPTLREVRAAAQQSGAARLQRIGAALYHANCASCHGDLGEGGIGPSLRTQDLLQAVDENYLHRSIVEGRPGTAMPAWSHLSAPDVAALLAHLDSWRRGDRFGLRAVVTAGDPAVGELYYRTSCAACHGEQAEGGVGPQLANPVFLDSVSDELLSYWIRKGRAGTAMKGFAAEEQGPTTLRDSQVADIVSYLRRLGVEGTPPPAQTGAGDPTVGRLLYEGNCASCHGYFGEGASGPQLNNPQFLAAASDGFLSATIVLGRVGTPMRAMVHGREELAQIEAANVADIIAYMRLWQRPYRMRRPRAVAEMSKRAIDAGSAMYAEYCSPCHGPNGRGGLDGEDYFAPALNNPEFLAAASDGFLLATIARGRRDTAMPSYGQGSESMVSMPAEHFMDIVSYIRSWDHSSSPEPEVSR